MAERAVLEEYAEAVARNLRESWTEPVPKFRADLLIYDAVFKADSEYGLDPESHALTTAATAEKYKARMTVYVEGGAVELDVEADGYYKSRGGDLVRIEEGSTELWEALERDLGGEVTDVRTSTTALYAVVKRPGGGSRWVRLEPVYMLSLVDYEIHA